MKSVALLTQLSVGARGCQDLKKQQHLEEFDCLHVIATLTIVKTLAGDFTDSVQLMVCLDMTGARHLLGLAHWFGHRLLCIIKHKTGGKFVSGVLRKPMEYIL